MISNRWIEKRRSSWDRLRALMATLQASGVASLPPTELREMALLYRQIAGDLSLGLGEKHRQKHDDSCRKSDEK